MKKRKVRIKNSSWKMLAGCTNKGDGDDEQGAIIMFSYEMSDDPNQKADHFISGDGDGNGFPHISSYVLCMIKFCGLKMRITYLPLQVVSRIKIKTFKNHIKFHGKISSTPT